MARRKNNDAKDTAQPKSSSKGGCLRGIVVLAMLVAIAAIAVSLLGGDGEKHRLIGEILAFEEDGISITGETCSAPFGDHVLYGGENIFIGDGSLDGVHTELATGRVTSEGNCSFEFAADVQDTDLFGFTVYQMTALRKDRTIGKDVPDDYRHSQADTADWWVSIWATDFEP